MKAKREIRQASDKKLLQDWEKIGPDRIDLIDGYKELVSVIGNPASGTAARSDIIPMPIDRKERRNTPQKHIMQSGSSGI